MEGNEMSVWNDENTELVKKLWSDGLSASQIAARVGGVTRNAVIGKIHRLGLASRTVYSRKKSGARTLRPKTGWHTSSKPDSSKPKLQAKKKSVVNSLLLAPEEPLPVVEEVFIPLAERKQLSQLGDVNCKWPIGDPQDQENFHFCGKDKVAGLPYCELHARRAYRPPSRRRDETQPVKLLESV